MGADRKLDARLREAALAGDSKAARRLVLEGASIWILRPQPVLVSDLARKAGHHETAAAIDDAMVEAGRREAEREVAALRARCVAGAKLVREVKAGAGAAEVAITPGSAASAAGERWLAWAIEPPGRLRLLSDAWIAAEEVGEARRALPEVQWGGCDAMMRTTPRWVWAHSGESLRVWRRGALRARVDGRRVERRGALSWRRREVANLARVKVRLNPNWTMHQVIVSGRALALPIASRFSLAPLFDPTYDQLLLWVDAAWAKSLAEALGSVTGLPVDIPAWL